jgi:hypothetical protein
LPPSAFWFTRAAAANAKTFMDETENDSWFSGLVKTASEGYKSYTAGEAAKADKKLADAINNRTNANAQTTLFTTRNIIIAAVVGVVAVVALVMFTRK